MRFKQVDVSEKSVVLREATAQGRIRLRKETLERVRSGRFEKGDALGIATLTAVTGAKKTTEILALTHLLPLEQVEPEVKVFDDAIEVTVKVKAHAKTGVEMEALTAVAVALLNVWDVVKQYEKDSSGQYPTTAIESLRVVKKVKGKA